MSYETNDRYSFPVSISATIPESLLHDTDTYLSSTKRARRMEFDTLMTMAVSLFIRNSANWGPSHQRDTFKVEGPLVETFFEMPEETKDFMQKYLEKNSRCGFNADSLITIALTRFLNPCAGIGGKF
jgi:hypothetical protein